MTKIFTKKLYVKKLRLENNNASFPLKKQKWRVKRQIDI